MQDLVVWTASQVLPTPSYDEERARWTVVVDKNGEQVTLHPKHIVLATGTLGDPFVPTISSMGSFKGTVSHASSYAGGHTYSGKRVLVVGAGNTGADVCQDLHARGAASVTMLQRSKTCVVSSAIFGQQFSKSWPEGVPTEVNDFKAAALPLGLLKELTKESQKEVDDFDKEMQEGLKRAGLKLTTGPDGSGLIILVFERLGGERFCHTCIRSERLTRSTCQDTVRAIMSMASRTLNDAYLPHLSQGLMSALLRLS
jgi:cation diffusion facilitator CzcD-associated flavoprotein CzcO